jgi:hypothetical protein
MIDQELHFIRGARHLVYNPKKTIEVGHGAYHILLAIERRLIRESEMKEFVNNVRLMIETQKALVDGYDTEQAALHYEEIVADFIAKHDTSVPDNWLEQPKTTE